MNAQYKIPLSGWRMLLKYGYNGTTIEKIAINAKRVMAICNLDTNS